MGSLSGTILNRVGLPLTPARIVLVPSTGAAAQEITLASDGSFTLASVADGTYSLQLRFVNVATQEFMTVTTPTFTVSGATTLASPPL